MSIVTKTGDKGTTSLMYGRRILKSHPVIEAIGTVDELNAALGLARAATEQVRVRESLLSIQKHLVALMGELAAAPEDIQQYVSDGHSRVTPAMTKHLEEQVVELEAEHIHPQGWATPGSGMPSAALDLARAVCRRAERRVVALQAEGQLGSGEVLVYLNRLADLLWLLARWVDARSGGG